MRPFAYFSGEGKVGRGTGPEAPKGLDKKHLPLGPEGRSTLLSLSDPLIHRVQHLRHTLAQPGKLLGQRLRVHRR